MKVCYVITRAETGGAQFHVRDLCIRLKQDGHEAHVIVGDNDVLVSQLEKQGIPVTIMKHMVREISPLKDLLGLFELRKLIRNISPDVVALHSSKAGALGRLGLVGTGIPVIFTAHGWAFTDGISKGKQYFYTYIEKICSHFCDKIITVSAHDKRIGIEAKVADDNKQIVIHNGIFHLDQNIERVMQPVTTIISVARFAEQKDHATLIHALALCKDLKWHLNLVGKGETLASIRNLVDNYGLNEQVSFLGECSNIDSLLAQSDIFTLISNWEGLPISILEAMRIGLPVIASDVGGVRETISDGITGFLVERKNSKQLAEKLRILIQDRQLCQSMGDAGYQKFLADFTFDKMYEKTFREYQLIAK